MQKLSSLIRKPAPTDLSWDERNPSNYLYSRVVSSSNGETEKTKSKEKQEKSGSTKGNRKD